MTDLASKIEEQGPWLLLLEPCLSLLRGRSVDDAQRTLQIHLIAEASVHAIARVVHAQSRTICVPQIDNLAQPSSAGIFARFWEIRIRVPICEELCPVVLVTQR